MENDICQSFYLIVRQKGYYDLAARISSRAPKLEAGEVAMNLTVKVPRSLFTQPVLKATVTIPESAVTAPVVNAEVLDNVRELIAQQTGMEVKVSVIEPTQVVTSKGDADEATQVVE